MFFKKKIDKNIETVNLKFGESNDCLLSSHLSRDRWLFHNIKKRDDHKIITLFGGDAEI